MEGTGRGVTHRSDGEGPVDPACGNGGVTSGGEDTTTHSKPRALWL